jgi:hypothetical protein
VNEFTRRLFEKLQIAIFRKDDIVKDIIESYRQTREALIKRREELCQRRGDYDRRITLLDFEIGEVEEVLRTLAKYDEETEAAA